MKISEVTVTRREMAELLPSEPPGSLGPEEIRGRTLVSLVSPGTEIQAYLSDSPSTPGYAAVFIAEEIGCNVEGINRGEQLFCMGGHRSLQQLPSKSVVRVPEGLTPEEAVLARLMGVTITTLMTTLARPGDVVVVTGAGPVGYLCAHLFSISGYEVLVVEPNTERCRIAIESGLEKVFASVPENDKINGSVALVVDCSGHEQAVLDGARIVRKGGEIVLVGVPWLQRTNLTAHELLHLVFHKYAVLRSGWEWALPHHASGFQPHSIYGSFRLALRWLADQRIPCEDIITLHTPENAQDLYQGLHHGSLEGLFQIFDWRNHNQ